MTRGLWWLPRVTGKAAPVRRIPASERARADLVRADLPAVREKGPEDPISVVADKAVARGANPAYDRSFWQRGVLAAGTPS